MSSTEAVKGAAQALADPLEPPNLELSWAADGAQASVCLQQLDCHSNVAVQLIAALLLSTVCIEKYLHACNS